MHVGAVAVLEREPFYDARRALPARRRADPRRVAAAADPALPPPGRWTCRSARVARSGSTTRTSTSRDHVRLTALPAPGSRRQLLELAERLMAQVLDRDRPLWELWFVEGVDRGEHVGLIHKSHHTLTDGISGVDIATVLLDFSAEPTVLDPDGWEPEPAPDPTRLMLDSACASGSRRPVELAGRAHAGWPTARARSSTRAAELGRSIGSLVDAQIRSRRASRSTRRSAAAAGSRRCGCRSTTVKQMRKGSGARSTTSCSPASAARSARLLDARGELRAELVAQGLLPGVGARRRASACSSATASRRCSCRSRSVSPTRASRLDAVRASHRRPQGARAGGGCGRAARTLRVRRADVARARGARRARAARSPTSSSPTSPGPQVPLYCLGAQMLEVYPIVPLSRNLTLNVAMLSYCGELHFGLVGDGTSGRDLETARRWHRGRVRGADRSASTRSSVGRRDAAHPRIPPPRSPTCSSC